MSEMCLSPPHFKWMTTQVGLPASLHCLFSTLMCFMNEGCEGCESHHSPRNSVDCSTARCVFPILTVWGLVARDRVAVKCTTSHLWAANLKPFLVARSCMAFTANCKYLCPVTLLSCGDWFKYKLYQLGLVQVRNFSPAQAREWLG